MARRRKQNLKHWSNEQLQRGWEQGFECRVKTGRYKGCITVKAATLGDAILWEASTRGLSIITPKKYQ